MGEAQNIVQGRPDLKDWSFGKTRAKRHPKYVYGNRQGFLMHEILYVELHWYDPHYSYLIRRTHPRVIIHTRCGYTFFLQHRGGLKNGQKRSTMCEIVKPEAVLCGKCRGEEPTFGRNSQPTVTKREARARIGCEEVVQINE